MPIARIYMQIAIPRPQIPKSIQTQTLDNGQSSVRWTDNVAVVESSLNTEISGIKALNHCFSNLWRSNSKIFKNIKICLWITCPRSRSISEVLGWSFSKKTFGQKFDGIELFKLSCVVVEIVFDIVRLTISSLNKGCS